MALAPLQDGDPRVIAGYRLIGRLGAGGMGVVFLADRADGQLVAIKQMRAELAGDATFRARFAREATAVIRVVSACTARVLAVNSGVPRPFLVMEYVPGLSVVDQVAAHGPLPPERVRALALGLAAAVAAIHAAGVVHRDLKPANVLLSPNGPRVIDFGIAQTTDTTPLTSTGSAIGSPGYMAPEQLSGRAGAPSDVFAWALTVAFAATGRPPFGTGPAAAVLYRIAHGDPDITGIPPDLRAFVDAALAKDPAARPTAAELLQRLLGGDLRGDQQRDHTAEAVVTRLWTQTRIDPDVPEQLPRRRIRRWLLPTVAAAGVVLAAGLIASLLEPHTAPTSAANAATSSTTVPEAATRVMIYQPWTPAGLTSQITVTHRSTGSCFSSSRATGRVDAYRCTTGSELHDPCFSNPFTIGSYSQEVACEGPDRDHVTLIMLTAPLPDPWAGPSSPGPWELQLTDGAICSSLTGATTTVASLRQNYGCTDGGSLYGAPDTSSETWTIHYQAKDNPNLQIVPITAAYE